MITVTKNIQLQPILEQNIQLLYQLMCKIYPPAYHHFWKDQGAWYVNYIYTKENVIDDLKTPNTNFYFIVFKSEIVGVFRVIHGETLKGFEEKKAIKLQRLYLHQNVQGKGIGKKLMRYLIEKSTNEGFDILWLDAMNSHTQAFNFYKNQGFKYHSHIFLPFELMHDQHRKMSQIYKIL